ncbi:hypothetical protein [Streptomyces sp. NPDC003077]
MERGDEEVPGRARAQIFRIGQAGPGVERAPGFVAEAIAEAEVERDDRG